MTWLLMVLLVLTCHRVTRLLVRDELPLIKRPRDALANWLDPRDEHGAAAEPSPLGSFGRSLAYLIECDWCTGVWVGAALVAATNAAVGVPYPWLMWPAVASLTGLLATLEAHTERRGRLDELRVTEVQFELRKRGWREVSHG